MVTVTSCSRRGYVTLTARLRHAHGEVTSRSRRGYVTLTARLRHAHGEVTSRSRRGYVTLTARLRHAHGEVTSRSRRGYGVTKFVTSRHSTVTLGHASVTSRHVFMTVTLFSNTVFAVFEMGCLMLRVYIPFLFKCGQKSKF
jgi:hypothetical protein